MAGISFSLTKIHHPGWTLYIFEEAESIDGALALRYIQAMETLASFETSPSTLDVSKPKEASKNARNSPYSLLGKMYKVELRAS